MNTNITNVCFIGAGYIGGSSAPIMALKNPHINFTVVDIDVNKINRWNSNCLPIYEPGLDDIVQQIRGKNLFFSTNIEDAVKQSEIIFIGVNTPTKTYGNGIGEASDLTYWEGAARTIAQYANNSKIIVEKSTLPVKTAESISILLKQLNPNFNHTIISNPEFLAEGTAVDNLLNPDRVLIGSLDDDYSIAQMQKVADIYRAWVPENKIITTGLWTSELGKLASNAMLAQRVSSINSFACVCEEVDANIDDIAKILSSDLRIGNKFLKAGPGFGGSCFKKDILNLIYICKTLGLNEVADYWYSVINMNNYQYQRVVKRILNKSFNTLSNKNVCILGYAFKAYTGDTRETPSKYIINTINDEHCNSIRVHDYEANDNAKHELKNTPSCTICDDPYDACNNADIIIVCTDWPQYKELDWNKIYNNMINQKLIFDARNYLDHDELKCIGFQVMSVGKVF